KMAGVPAVLLGCRAPFIEKEIVADHEGRYVVVRGTLYGEEVVLASVYAPNGKSVIFYSQLTQVLNRFRNVCYLVGGGDWNARADRSGRPLPSDSRTSRAIHHMAKNVSVTDIWRKVHEWDREYTHLSQAHKCYSRLHMIFVFYIRCVDRLVCAVRLRPSGIKILPFTNLIKSSNWRLNGALLKDNICKSMLAHEISGFFATNEGLVSSLHTLWDSFKASVRGWLISFVTARKKQFCKDWQDIEVKMWILERMHMINPNDEGVYSQLLQAKCKLQQLINSKTEFAFSRAKRIFFESRNKMGCLLAYKLGKQEVASMIQCIKKPSGVLASDPKQISEGF
uniref:MAF bZIP transcription factor G n=1 Tax=Latimeria chalumnae TaxID=7897 RepID=H3AHY7_LATCH